MRSSFVRSVRPCSQKKGVARPPGPRLLGALARACIGLVQYNAFQRRAMALKPYKTVLFRDSDTEPYNDLSDVYCRLLLCALDVIYGPEGTPRLPGVIAPEDSLAVAWDKKCDDVDVRRVNVQYPTSRRFSTPKREMGDLPMRFSWSEQFSAPADYARHPSLLNWRTPHSVWQIEEVCVILPMISSHILHETASAADSRDPHTLMFLQEVEKTRTAYKLRYFDEVTGDFIGNIHARPLCVVLGHPGHYSLLVTCDGDVWHHYDSLRSGLHDSVAAKFIGYLYQDSAAHLIQMNSLSAFKRYPMHAPRFQEDGTSCLLYCLMVADYFLSTRFETFPSVQEQILPKLRSDSVIQRMRESCIDWYTLILQERFGAD